MNQFVLIFRMDVITEEAQPTPEQMQVYMEQWMAWINDIDSQGKLANGGNHLSKEGKVLRANNVISDGPYVANQESVAGYIIIYADDLADALKIAKKCPILMGEGTCVEVREVGSPRD